MSDSKAILCMLILMRLKTELSHFDRLRLHKSALMVNIFSQKKCFTIIDPTLTYFDEIDKLSVEIKKVQEQYGSDTAKTLELTLQSVDLQVKESYNRSTPYVLQSAGFVDSITDDKTLILASAIVGIVGKCGSPTTNDIEFYMDKIGCQQDYSRKDIISAAINLEKTGVIVKTESSYKLNNNFKDVSGYVRLI